MKRQNHYLLLFLLPIFINSGCSSNLEEISYGVFLGLDHYENRLSSYKEIVIDVAEWSSSDIQKLKNNGQTIYSYLSIGSLENYRDYYDDFKDHVLGPYENWDDEYWMDVSYAPWQEKMESLAKELINGGADGLFLDNSDVYYFYNNQSILKGLDIIYSKLDALGVPLINNGGDTYVDSLLERNKTSWLYGINQESVFSSIIDYDNDVFGKQDEEDTKYYKEYISKCDKANLSIRLLEYTTDDSVKKEIKEYCSTNNYLYYISNHVDLI